MLRAAYFAPARDLRQCAALGLALKPAEGAIQPLVQALSDEDSMVSSLAVNALVKIGNAAVPSLIDIVKNSPQSARIHALRALLCPVSVVALAKPAATPRARST